MTYQSENNFTPMGISNSQRLAKVILNGFDAFFGDFQNLTLGAQARFEQADWQAVHAAMSERLEMYKKKVRDVAALAEQMGAGDLQNIDLWKESKSHYERLVETHSNYEIAQTFFNSVYCFVRQHERIRDSHVFMLESDRQPEGLNEELILCEYSLADLNLALRAILEDTQLNIPFANIDRDIENIAQQLLTFLSSRNISLAHCSAQMIQPLFYRNKAAYLVGRIKIDNDNLPLVLPILNNEQGKLYVDAALMASDEVSKLFSFTRSYFMVDASIPSQIVGFLKSILPDKQLFELYSAIGFGKHAKTVFYRRSSIQAQQGDDLYVSAPGIKGMVMLVFTLPSFNYVFKVIKDRFTPPKDTTREHVRAQYKLVKRWDRAGRMAETQEFNNLTFDRRRFSEELIEEFKKHCPSMLELRGNAAIIKHVYVERRMTPLNLYIKDASEEQLHHVMNEYGNAIKELAAANIFPGDMLLKNFGVTRHSRVVFYDYDEICPLTDCQFRAIPEPQTEEQEMASQPWYDVADNDIFPEEFALFFAGNRRAREVFSTLHPDLYTVNFWQSLQQQVRRGMFGDVFPYQQKYRFAR